MRRSRGGTVLEARCITKTYGSTAANDCLSFSVHPGEILGVLGENGAGKSTLLSILAGVTRPDGGQLFVNGVPTAFRAPADALRAGISIVFQHFSLVPTFTVREQMRLSGWKARQLPELLATRFSGDELISEISLGGRQLVEIARALVSRPRILLLDEPTSILTAAETEQLFLLMRELSGEGTSVLFVTHKLHEAMDVCDRIMVLRKGEAVGTIERSPSGWSSGAETDLLGMMFGASHGSSGDISMISDHAARSTSHPREQREPSQGTLFCVRDVVTSARPGRQGLRKISFDVRGGEISAIVGIDGQGQRELAEVCAGYAPADGTAALDGRVLPFGHARDFRRAGIAYLTDDRIGEGAVPGFSIESNLVMKRQRDRPFSRYGLLRRGVIRDQAREHISQWRIEPSNPLASIGTLSGGNLQKVLLARELSIASSLLIANKPSQGLDSRTQSLVWSVIGQFAADQGSVLLFTTDIDEAFAHADRVAVIYEGAVSTLLPVGTQVRSHLERMMVAGW